MRLRSASIAAFVRRSSRVRSSSRSWRNLNSERIVWSATLRPSRRAPAAGVRGGVVGTCGDPRLQVEGLAFGPLDVPCPAAGRAAKDASAPLDRCGERRPRQPFDRLAVDSAPCSQNASFAADHVVVVELDDPVHGGLEDQPEVFLGLAERLVRSRARVRARCRPRRGRSPCRPGALGLRRAPGCWRIWFARMRAATPDARATPMIKPDCTPLDPALVVQRGDGGEGRTRRDHGDAREHRAGQMPATLVLRGSRASGEQDDRRGQQRAGTA